MLVIAIENIKDITPKQILKFVFSSQLESWIYILQKHNFPNIWYANNVPQARAVTKANNKTTFEVEIFAPDRIQQ